MHERAGSEATTNDLTNIDALVDAYYSHEPDVSDPAQRVIFGTSGHRGSALNGSFNEAHIAAITQAIVDYRTREGITGPLFLGADTHALSAPATKTALAVLAHNRVTVLIDSRDDFVPTPALSHAIITRNRTESHAVADGIVVTPSHNPPADGGFKYNPPHGGPAETAVSTWIAERANELLSDGISRYTEAPDAETYDFRDRYVNDLASILNMETISDASLTIGVDPLGGASVNYWPEIIRQYDLPITIMNTTVDPQWAFMPLDWDEKIRMDPSSPTAMSFVEKQHDAFDLILTNDADADRHGIITRDHGLMNPNHYLAVSIDYLFTHRPGWDPSAAVGKTMVSSRIIERVARSLGRNVCEVPVGFKWFVPGLRAGSVAFGGEESAGASFLRKDGSLWTSDKDGILLCLLAAEIYAATGTSPSTHYDELTKKHGASTYERIDVPATPPQKDALKKLSSDAITTHNLAGDPITAIETTAPCNNKSLGGIRVSSAEAWFAARPSGTEHVYKIYAESFRDSHHLAQVQKEARSLVESALRQS